MSDRQWSPMQLEIFRAVASTRDNLMIEAVAGSGKCLGLNTPVLMFDGSIHPVQDVRPGDQLMGPDSRPRTVLSTSRGTGPLFHITPVKGTPWVCNDIHVMTLQNSVTREIFDVPLNKFLRNRGTRRNADAKLLRAAVEFPPRATPLEPYLLGLWIGDGAYSGPRISKPDVEIHQYLQAVAPRYGVTAKITFPKGKCPNIDLTGDNFRKGPHTPNPVREEFKRCIVSGEKRIPQEYLVNSTEARLQLLAGILDTDGHLHNGHFDLATKCAGLCRDILFLARSLGFAAYGRPFTGKIKNTGFSGQYHRISISGELDRIPCRLPRRQASPRRQKKSVLRTGFSASPIGTGPYFGFTLDGDGRFLLGDFTVTHNTTTIVEALRYTQGRVLFLAFNKHIADELGRRVPSHVEVRTCHSFGFAAIKRSLGAGVTLDQRKIWGIMADRIGPRHIAAAAIRQTVSLAKNYLVDQESDLLRLIEHHDIDLPKDVRAQDVARHAAVVLQACRQSTATVDFDDMVWLPLVLNHSFPVYTTVFVDESQDLNEAQKELVGRAVGEAGRLVCVGDPAQAIYGWRGSDCDAMANLKHHFGCRTLPLSVSYRCPREVVRVARLLVRDIQPAPGAQAGVVRRTPREALADEARPGDMVLCRTVAPLLELFFELLRHRIKAVVRGRDIGLSLVKFIEKFGARDLDHLFDLLDAHKSSEIAALTRQQKEQEAAHLADKIEAVVELASRVSSIPALIQSINEIFSDEVEGVVLSTIHRSKGLEAENVMILRPDLIPHPRARASWARKQEWNLAYVAVTRSLKRLTFVGRIPTWASTLDESDDGVETLQDDSLDALLPTSPDHDRHNGSDVDPEV